MAVAGLYRPFLHALTALWLCACSSSQGALSEDARLDALVRQAAAEKLAADPALRTKLTADGDTAAWTPVSDEARERQLRRVGARLQELSSLNVDMLSTDGRIDYAIYKSSLEYEQLYARAINDGSFLYGNVLEPGVDYADILASSHALTEISHAENYVQRLHGLPVVLEETLEAMAARHRNGVTMMKSAYRQVANRAAIYASGAPCDGDGVNPLYASFVAKLKTSGIEAAKQGKLAEAASAALTMDVCPAYKAYVEHVLKLGEAGRDAAAWTLPNGGRFYRDAIELSIGERVDPSIIHRTGIEEVKRIRDRMRALMVKTGFEGNLDAFTKFLREGGGGSLPNNEEGRAQYIRMAEAKIKDIYARMPGYFNVVPETPVVVEIPSSGPMGGPPSAGAYYTEAPADRSRPAVFHLGVGSAPRINTWSLAQVTFHEIAPGHHHQVETFRALGDGEGYPRPFYPGYFDGWALYAEDLAREMGAYDDDVYSEIGWLQGQLTRAIRMVVDTGLNSERWTEDEANAYQFENSASIERLNRFLIWPGQGLSYYWGYLEFRRLRRQAEERLGDRFDLKEFHEIVLKIGPVPLSVLQTAVEIWMEAKLADHREK